MAGFRIKILYMSNLSETLKIYKGIFSACRVVVAILACMCLLIGWIATCWMYLAVLGFIPKAIAKAFGDVVQWGEMEMN